MGKSCKTKGSDLRVHFKNTREAAQAIKGMHLNKAVAYMKAVIAKERCIPFNRFSGSIGRTAQTKEFKSPTSKGRWPEKSCPIVLTVASIPTWLPHVTLRSFSLSVRSPSPAPPSHLAQRKSVKRNSRNSA